MTVDAIRLEAVSKSYRDWRNRPNLALDDVSLSVKEGEAFGFVGPNGAGKSTTIKILTGAIQLDSGQASIWGTSIDSPKARTGLGYVPENPYLQDYLTPFEILTMGLSLHGVKMDSPSAHCMHWLERFSIAQVAKKQIRGFSKGMMQRTALAHALACRPRLLILDEPLSGLDPLGRRDVVDILLEYRQQGGTIFFSSHVLHDVERLADNFGLIHKGKLRTVQTPHELIGDDRQFLVRSVGDQAVEGMQADVGARWSAQVEQHQLWPLLQRLEQANHRLLEVKPSLSLETAFLRYVEGDLVDNRSDV